MGREGQDLLLAAAKPAGIGKGLVGVGSCSLAFLLMVPELGLLLLLGQGSCEGQSWLSFWIS